MQRHAPLVVVVGEVLRRGGGPVAAAAGHGTAVIGSAARSSVEPSATGAGSRPRPRVVAEAGAPTGRPAASAARPVNRLVPARRQPLEGGRAPHDPAGVRSCTAGGSQPVMIIVSVNPAGRGPVRAEVVVTGGPAASAGGSPTSVVAKIAFALPGDQSVAAANSTRRHGAADRTTRPRSASQSIGRPAAVGSAPARDVPGTPSVRPDSALHRAPMHRRPGEVAGLPRLGRTRSTTATPLALRSVAMAPGRAVDLGAEAVEHGVGRRRSGSPGPRPAGAAGSRHRHRPRDRRWPVGTTSGAAR